MLPQAALCNNSPGQKSLGVNKSAQSNNYLLHQNFLQVQQPLQFMPSSTPPVGPVLQPTVFGGVQAVQVIPLAQLTSRSSADGPLNLVLQ